MYGHMYICVCPALGGEKNVQGGCFKGGMWVRNEGDCVGESGGAIMGNLMWESVWGLGRLLEECIYMSTCIHGCMHAQLYMHAHACECECMCVGVYSCVCK